MSTQPVTGQQIEASYGITAASFEAFNIATRALFRAAYACDVLHVQEVPKGSNRGPDVERYQAAAGSGPGEPWCIQRGLYWPRGLYRKVRALSMGHFFTETRPCSTG